MTMNKTLWLSYDLGVQGDYESLYRWLDQHQAKECGDSLAVLQYPTKPKAKTNWLNELRQELEEAIDINQRSRIYVIYTNDKGKMSGRFLIGNRRAPAWTGYAPVTTVEEDA
jgi:hypothetical protein